MFAAGAVALAIGTNPLEKWVGSYNTLRGAQAILQKEGGLVNLITRRFGELLDEVLVPVAGDVGIVVVPYVSEGGPPSVSEVAAVYTGLWTVKTARGIAGHDYACVKAWRCPWASS